MRCLPIWRWTLELNNAVFWNVSSGPFAVPSQFHSAEFTVDIWLNIFRSVPENIIASSAKVVWVGLFCTGNPTLNWAPQERACWQEAGWLAFSGLFFYCFFLWRDWLLLMCRYLNFRCHSGSSPPRILRQSHRGFLWCLCDPPPNHQRRQRTKSFLCRTCCF